LSSVDDAIDKSGKELLMVDYWTLHLAAKRDSVLIPKASKQKPFDKIPPPW